MKSFVQILFLSAMLLPGTLNAYKLPMLGNSNENVLSDSQEKLVGKSMFQMIDSHIKVIKDPLLQDYIQTIGNRLVSQAPKQAFPFHFFFIQHNAVNAFTAPGGYIAVHTGLMDAVKNEAELAAVLSHEMSHATQRHIARGMERAKIDQFATIGAMVAAIALGSQVKGGDAMNGALMTAQALGAEDHLNFSREQEQEADRLGIDLLYRSGYDPNAMPQFLRTMSALSDSDRSLVTELLSTHPLTDSRIADTQNRATQLAKKPFRHDNQKFNLMVMRLHIINSRDPGQLRRELLLLRKKQPNHEVALQYGIALASSKTGDYQTATNAMQSLIKQYPNQLIFKMGLAEIYDQQRDFKQATAVLAEQYRWHFDYLPLVQQYADILLAQDNAKASTKIINDYLEDHEATPSLLRLCARGCAKLGNLSQAYLHNATANYLEGDYRGAHRLAIQALKMKHLAANTRVALKQLIDQCNEMKSVEGIL